jgi:alpha-ribazole phosphatase/probable phosphoglycerate mutase
MPTEIIYETHSLTLDNESGHATGWLPGELSVEGRRLASEMGERYRDAGLVAVFVSDLRRAVQTAEIAFGNSGLSIHQDARLRECNYGDLNGMPVAQLAVQRSKHIEVPFPNGQSYRSVVDQTRSFLADLARDHDGERVIVIAHSANKWALDVLLCGARLEDLVDAPFGWQEGWRYTLPSGWAGEPAATPVNLSLQPPFHPSHVRTRTKGGTALAET